MRARKVIPAIAPRNITNAPVLLTYCNICDGLADLPNLQDTGSHFENVILSRAGAGASRFGVD